MGKLAIMNHIILTIIIIIIIIITIIIIFNIYIAQINIQEDMIKCPLQLKLNPKLLCYLFTILNLQENAKNYTM